MTTRSLYSLVVKDSPGPGGCRLVTRELPPPEPGEALVRIRRAAICGTDLHIVGWNAYAARTYRLPVALGHELSGTVARLDPETANTAGVAVGDRVACETHLGCRRCAQCRAGRGHTCRNLRVYTQLGRGAFAEYASIPADMLRVLPPGLPHRHGCLLEPLGIAVRAVAESGAAGGHLLVTGCGPIGLLTIAAARAMGVPAVAATDYSRARLDLAGAVGAGVLVQADAGDAASVLRGAAEDGFDTAIDTTGSPAALAGSLELLRPGGTLMLAGLPDQPVPIDVARHLVLREITLRGVYGRRLVETWSEVRRLAPVLAPALDRIITHEFPLADFDAALDAAASGQAGKVQFVME